MTKGRFLQIESPEILHRVTSETWHCMYGCVHTLDIDEIIFQDIRPIKIHTLKINVSGLRNRFKSRGGNFSNPYKLVSNLREVYKLMGAT